MDHENEIKTYMYNTIELSFTRNHSVYSVKLSSPLGYSDYNIISVLCPIALVSPLNPPKRKFFFWHYASAKCEDLRL